MRQPSRSRSCLRRKRCEGVGVARFGQRQHLCDVRVCLRMAGASARRRIGLVATCRRRDGSTAGVLPLVVTKERGLRVVRLIGHGAAERLAPPCADEERPLVAAALREFLLAGDCDLFLGEQMPAEEGWARMLGGAVLGASRARCCRIDGRSWDEYLIRQSANFRQQVRKREKRLAKQGELSFRITEDADELAADMETFLELHDSRWAEQGSTPSRGGSAMSIANSLRWPWQMAGCVSGFSSSTASPWQLGTDSGSETPNGPTRRVATLPPNGPPSGS